MNVLDFSTAVAALRAAAEPTRLRLLALLDASELNVTDLTFVLGQSQPRISRHLKLLVEAGLVERYREGSWVFLRLAEIGPAGRLARQLIGLIDADDPALRRDRERAEVLRSERAAAAQAYFAGHAAEWDSIRRRHVDEAIVEATMQEALGADPKKGLGTLVDLGTGTGRILELLASNCARGIGIDANATMLAHARTRLEALGHNHVQLRHGDIYHLTLADRSATTVVMHQVLHFLTSPGQALREAGRILEPNGQLLIVDFAAHDQDELRDVFAHQRLGFTTEQIVSWLAEAGLTLVAERTLEPGQGVQEQALVVRMWLARRTEVAERPARKSSTVSQDRAAGPHAFENVR